MKKKILIVGAGNIAIRHSQSLLNNKNVEKIYVYDINISSINNFKNFFSHCINKKKFVYFTSLKKIKIKFFFLAIICTYAFNRIIILNKILKIFNIKNTIVEKILETNLINYPKVKLKGNIFVNIPMRNILPFRNISKKLLKSPLKAKLKGKNWNLISNSLHYINFINFSQKTKIADIIFYNLKKIKQVKRKNLIDYLGTIKILFINGSVLELISDNKSKNHFFEVKQNRNTFRYDFKKSFLQINRKKILQEREKISDLTKFFFNALVKNKKPNLPSIDDHIDESYLFIKSLKNIIKDKNDFERIT